jgi:1,4-alpha-glucan branching enzyme
MVKRVGPFGPILPQAEAAWVLLPESHKEFAMESHHNPHFFECVLEISDLANYQLKYVSGDHEHVIYDPYAFKTRTITDFDVHLFAEGNHHRIYEKLGAHLTTMDGIRGLFCRLGSQCP